MESILQLDIAYKIVIGSYLVLSLIASIFYAWYLHASRDPSVKSTLNLKIQRFLLIVVIVILGPYFLYLFFKEGISWAKQSWESKKHRNRKAK